ncbi:MAG: hypothetical protein AAF770_01695 [Bacteroidota bacterium]
MISTQFSFKRYSIGILLYLANVISTCYAAEKQQSTIQEFLQNNKLGAYFQAIREEGYEELYDFLEANQDELQELAVSPSLAMKKPHQRKFLELINQLQKKQIVEQLQQAERIQEKQLLNRHQQVKYQKELKKLSPMGGYQLLVQYDMRKVEKIKVIQEASSGNQKEVQEVEVNVWNHYEKNCPTLITTIACFACTSMEQIIELGNIMGSIDYANQIAQEMAAKNRPIYIRSSQAWEKQCQKYKDQLAEKYQQFYGHTLYPIKGEIYNVMLFHHFSDIDIFVLVRCLSYLLYLANDQKQGALAQGESSSTKRMSIKSRVNSVVCNCQLQNMLTLRKLDPKNLDGFIQTISEPLQNINISAAQEYQQAIYRELVKKQQTQLLKK